MTTIAFRDGILAADSQVSYCDAAYDTKRKKIAAGNGIMVGACGDVAFGDAFKQWALEEDFFGDELPDYPLPIKGTTGIVILDKGKRSHIIEYSRTFPYDVGTKLPFLAWGSGWQFAVGAMEQGASAVEAVKIAARRDLGTGGRVISLTFNKGKK